MALFAVSVLMGLVSIALRIAMPAAAPQGFTSLVLTIIFFGSINILAVSIVGEYIAKIFEEVKRRPHFVRRYFIRDGERRLVPETSEMSVLQNRQE